MTLLTSRVALLRVLLMGPGYGAELAARVRERSEGAVELNDARLYRLLRELEVEGFVCRLDKPAQARQIHYALTPEGEGQARRLIGEMQITIENARRFLGND